MGWVFFMFNQDEKTAMAQQVMLEILKVIHSICVKNGIKYTLIAGTLLGAVRHKGFIPWDDDCDIAMLRPDYERFLEIAARELPKEYFLQTQKTDPNYPLFFAKVRKNSTLLIETGETGEENYHHGVFVDIFPFDYYKYRWLINWMHWTQTVRDRKKRYKRGSVIRAVVTFYTNIILLIPVQISLLVKRYLERRKAFFSNPDYDYVSYGLECCPICPIKKEDFLPEKLVRNIFEGEEFNVPNREIEVLRVEFGDDFMQLPPEENRKTHAKYISV